jgi:stearoyl-CoA desaturase (delta-9 desaturase)
MPFDVLSLLADGLLPLPWWGYVLVTLALTHITIACVTIYLHRHSAHRALDLAPPVSQLFRFWLWLTTGIVTKEWTSIHRKHHAKCETGEDPHSPQTRGLRTVFWRGYELYRAEARNLETLEKYGKGTPADWIERNLYSRFSWHGVALMLAIDLVLFGSIGLTIWAVQMVWIPVTAAGVINGVGHYWGYRNFSTADASTNIVPWGILIGGEELHNNHHAYGASAKLSSRWYEFDLGWVYIRALAALRLARVRKVAPRLHVAPTARPVPDFATLQAVIEHRYTVVAAYARSLRRTCASELDALRERVGRSELPEVPSLRRLKWWLASEGRMKLPEGERITLAKAMENSKALQTIYAMRKDLDHLWERSTESREQLLARLQDWCRRAETSGIPSLAQFSLQLRRYA